VELLVRNTKEDGCIPTWLRDGLKESTEQSAPQWLGERCLGVVTNALIGLLVTRWPVPDGYLDRVLRWIIETYEQAGTESAYFYPSSYCRLLLARLAVAAGSARFDAEVFAQLERISDDVERALLMSQAADGGWGSPLTTACHLGILALRGAPAARLRAAATHLVGRQEADGFWAREPFYRGPGKEGAPQNYGSRHATTAVCLHALATARTRFSVDQSGFIG
jgi:hypothetical protein